MNVLYTPKENFTEIPDYPFEENYFDLGDNLKMHYLDEGSKSDPVVLLLHGEPSWSFLYRKMIPVFLEAGYRVLCPDLIGFGKSGKPTDQKDYTYENHIQWTNTWLTSMEVAGIHLFAQDWGGLIGLRLVTSNPSDFASITVGNTGLPTGDQTPTEAFLQWQSYSQQVKSLPVSKILQTSTVRKLNEAELNAYSAPFPDASYQAGAKIFPSLVPSSPEDPQTENNREAWQILKTWKKPFLCLFSDSDPITKGGEKYFMKVIPGAQHEYHETIPNAGHFLQEDQPVLIANKMISFISLNQ